jgi:hypothetical protein
VTVVARFDRQIRGNLRKKRIRKGLSMGKVFRPSNRETRILSQIETSKERARRQAITSIHECIDGLSIAIAQKLTQDNLVETGNNQGLQDQIHKCLEKLARAEDFDVDFQIAPFRNLVANPNVISLYVTAFVIEKLLNDKDVVDIYGSDEEIYHCINRQVIKTLPA